MNELTLTPEAVIQARRLLASRPEVQGLRVSIERSGCAGYRWRIGYAETTDPEDHRIECEGVPLFVGAADLPLVRGTTVDYVRQGLNRMFRFENPNRGEVCGCGESFSVEGAGDLRK
jgi:iron-sulfur cluster assembly accessory protein